MTLEEIKENLCYNDLRNPNVTVDEETAKEIAENNADCYCDNCFFGKTALAEELLRYCQLFTHLLEQVEGKIVDHHQAMNETLTQLLEQVEGMPKEKTTHEAGLITDIVISRQAVINYIRSLMDGEVWKI